MPESASLPFVSVVLPVRNERRTIESCLAGILDQDYPRDRVEIVIADGLSDDGTWELLDQLASAEPRLIVMENQKRIAATGLNLAIARARGAVLLRMDAHSTYAPDYVLRCVEVLGRTGAANVGGPARTMPDLESRWARAIAAAYHSPFSVGGARFHEVDYEGPADTVPYGCWPRGTFEKHGLFDEELVRNQDDEHNLRIARGGGLIYQSPSIRSWYQTRSSLRDLFTQYSQYGYWKVRVIQKHRLPASPRHLVPVVFVLGLGGGTLLSLVFPVLGLPFMCAVATYGLLSLGFSVEAAGRSGWSLLPFMPIVFLVYHVAYGWGFLRGILDFVFLNRPAHKAMTTLSRPRKGGHGQ